MAMARAQFAWLFVASFVLGMTLADRLVVRSRMQQGTWPDNGGYNGADVDQGSYVAPSWGSGDDGQSHYVPPNRYASTRRAVLDSGSASGSFGSKVELQANSPGFVSVAMGESKNGNGGEGELSIAALAAAKLVAAAKVADRKRSIVQFRLAKGKAAGA